MGNRALRKQLSKMLGRKLYSGPKLRTFKNLPAAYLRRRIEEASYSEGDIVMTCSGFNKKICEKKTDYILFNHNVVISHNVFKFACSLDNNDCNCVSPPISKQEALENITSWFSDVDEKSNYSWLNMPFYKEVYRRFKNNEEILDENGCILSDLLKVD